MKTIIAVIFFGILNYAVADKINYGGKTCQKVTPMKDFNTARFFNGIWYLTRSTPSVHVTKSTICRGYNVEIRGEGWATNVTYGYYENGASGNRYDIPCFGIINSGTPGQYIFSCDLINERKQKTYLHISAYIIKTDYDKYGLVYTCVMSVSQFEDNVFLLFRDKVPDEEDAKRILSENGYDYKEFISRKEATCTN